MSGIVHLVGAGPGDPELLTLRAARLLGIADAIVHDRLVSPAILDLARPTVARYDVGKQGYGRSADQGATIELLIRLARAGLRVVRLKGGDPFVFGRGGEEALALRAAGIPFEVVPGVTAGTAGPAAAGIPVTHRGVARSVAFVTATTAEGRGPDWSGLAGVDTLVVFMAARAARATARGLLAAGRSPATPVAIVRSATMSDESIALTDLGRLAAGRGSGRLDPSDTRPTLLVVGAVVALAPLIGEGRARSGAGREAAGEPVGTSSTWREDRWPT